MVWGVDVSTRAVSLAAVFNGAHKTWTWEIPQEDKGARRLVAARALLARQLGGSFSAPELVCVEQPFGRFPKATLEQMVGVVLEVTASMVECPVLTLTPPQWKKEVGLSGGATKELVMRWARERGYDGHVQDEADAIGIACAGVEIYRRQS